MAATASADHWVTTFIHAEEGYRRIRDIRERLKSFSPAAKAEHTQLELALEAAIVSIDEASAALSRATGGRAASHALSHRQSPASNLQASLWWASDWAVEALELLRMPDAVGADGFSGLAQIGDQQAAYLRCMRAIQREPSLRDWLTNRADSQRAIADKKRTPATSETEQPQHDDDQSVADGPTIPAASESTVANADWLARLLWTLRDDYDHFREQEATLNGGKLPRKRKGHPGSADRYLATLTRERRCELLKKSECEGEPDAVSWLVDLVHGTESGFRSKVIDPTKPSRGGGRP